MPTSKKPSTSPSKVWKSSNAPQPRNLIVGIDPGASGGWSWWDGSSMECRPYKDAYDLAGWFELRRPTFALIELVHARPGNGVSSMFKFGTNFGIWQGIIAAFKIPFSTITAAKWQRLIGMPTGSSKNDLALRAKSLYPKLAATITQKTADAVLICHVARHQARELRHGVVLD